jgi:hypothetical protein
VGPTQSDCDIREAQKEVTRCLGDLGIQTAAGYVFLNGSSVLPYMTRSPPTPPGLGTPLGQDTVFLRLITNNF